MLVLPLCTPSGSLTFIQPLDISVNVFMTRVHICCYQVLLCLLWKLFNYFCTAVKKKLLSGDPQYPFPPGSHSSLAPPLALSQITPGSGEIGRCEIFSCSHLLLRNPNVGQNPGSSLLVYESFGSSETFLTCKMEMEEMDVRLQRGSIRLLG